MLLLPGNNCEDLCKKLSARLNAEIADVEKRRFPDGEIYLRILGDLSDEEILVVSDTRSDSGIMETIFLLEAARGMNPGKLHLFIPYFSYSRQHMRYKQGESVSSKALVDIYNQYVDSIITIDIHDEETVGFSEKPFFNLKMGMSLKEFYSDFRPDIIVSPDDGGIERAKRLGELLGSMATNLDKVRLDSRNVAIQAPEGVDFRGKKILLIDDIISTGGTMIKAMELLKSKGISSLSVCAIHGIFVNSSDDRISSIADDLSVTNTIQGDYSKIDISSEVARHLVGE